jgi:hypothetical protein
VAASIFIDERIVVVATFRLLGSSFIDLNLVIAEAFVVIKSEGTDGF